MIYLSGAVTRNLPPDLGVMLTPNMWNNPDLSARRWAADTGCFTQGADFDLERYLRYLAVKQPYRETCLFATAPDVVGDAEATWALSRPVLPRIRSLGFPAALVAQDGAERLDLDWDAFDALFIGGLTTTDWKLSPAAGRLCWEARSRGKWVHMGRLNSRRRLRRAFGMGCDSADGRFLAYSPDANLPRLRRWFVDLVGQTDLEELHA